MLVGTVLEHGFYLKPCGKYRAFLYWRGRLLGIYEVGGIHKVLEGMIRLMEALQEEEWMEWEREYKSEDDKLSML